MEGTITDGVLECTPPMAALSPTSVAEVEKALPAMFQNAWQMQNWSHCPVEGGTLTVDEYFIDCVDGDELEVLESNGHEVVAYNRMEQQCYPNQEEPVQQQHQQEQDAQTAYTAPPVPSSVPLPATSSYEGRYAFDVSCSSQTKSTKSVSFTYDEARRKVFANMNAVCPFRVFVNKAPPPGTVVRVMAVYSQPNDAQEIVKRCLVHVAEAEKIMKPGDRAPVDHFITCDHHSVQYHKNEAGRHSIIIQYEEPEAEVPYTEYRLRFMCLSSCNTGVNRRPVKLIWTLENNGNVLGRQGIDLKVCACPGRDRRNEEKMNAKQMDNSLLGLVTDGHLPPNGSSGSRVGHISTITHSQPRPQKRGWVATTTVVAGGPAKAVKLEQQLETEGEYMLRVPSKKMYNMLKMLRNALMTYKSIHPQAFRGSQSNGENCSPPMPALHTFADMLDAAARPSCSTSSPTNAAAQLATMKMDDNTDITSGPGALQCWMESIGLQSCFPLLLERGIRDLNSLKQIPFKTLKRLRLKEHQETVLISAMRSLSYDDEDEELFPSQELPGALSQGSTATLSQQSCTSTSSSKQYHVTRIRVVHPIQDHDYS